ncbi:glycosyltransferase 87 family protein [Streptomyces sp. NPDC001502]|uniref:glycosyltransferase 87 family protein n=1 Tax=Streptomyces sp. NPDC001502 TaxID=3364578 RepID=UPI003682F000
MTLSRTARWATGWLLAAAWALSFPLFSSLAPHRLWGWCAAAGYLGAAAATALGRRRAALATALLGAVAVPLLWLVLTGQGQSEVTVIERSARLLLESGRLYVDRPARVEDYTPYLPGMALLGIPRALLGGDGSGDGWAVRLLGDARIWCAAVLFGCLWAARRLLGGPWGAPGRLLGGGPGGAPGRLLPVLVASPVVALPLAVSGVDLPLAGLCCLALAAAAAGRPALAGAALAGACALKWTALPAVAVAVALLAVCRGGRAAVRCALVAAGGTALLVLPAALLQPAELWRQVFAFPTGRAEVPTPASSPLPGHLLAELGPWGWYLTVGLLLAGGLAVALSLLARPPRTVAAAADRLAVGLTLAFLLAPAGRFGYLALPVLLSVWARSVAVPGVSRVVTGSFRLRLRLRHRVRPSDGRPGVRSERPGGHFA